jgi:XTP/dITP diphosphohydrolase
MRLLVGTTNPGKIREIRRILADVTREHGGAVELVGLGDLPPIPEPEETGATFAENARLKAKYYAQATGLPCVADDSGLEIDALGGAPGVHSARWQGTDYAVKFQKIYELKGVGSPARFVCHVALAEADRVVFEAEGIVEGVIAAEPRGTNGFGYDPIFYYPPFGVTLAEIELDRKATVSHRGKAFAALRDHLRALTPADPIR